jgi:hypothetical protein
MATGWVAVLSVGAFLIAALALAGALIAWTRVRDGQSRMASLEGSLTALRAEFESLAANTIRTGLRVRRIEQEHSDVADRVELVESRGPGACVDEAIELARRGADPQKLERQFGLSPSEAELISRLHGGKKRSA